MNTLINCPVVILCGGKSSRMGENKSLLSFNGTNTLVEYQYKKLQKIFKEVYLSAKEDKFDFLEDKSKLILDRCDISSPMVALAQILKSFHNSYVFIIAVDIPLLKEETIYSLYETTKDKTSQIVVPVDGNGDRHNLCGFYHTSLSDTMDGFLEKDIHKIGALIQNSNSIQVTFDSIEEFLNMNNQEEYKKASIIANSF